MSTSKNVLTSRVLALLGPVTLGRLIGWHFGRSNPNHNDATEDDLSVSPDSTLVVWTRLDWTYCFSVLAASNSDVTELGGLAESQYRKLSPDIWLFGANVILNLLEL
jgi:hypothetical protein